ncbi:TIM barrel protein [Rouxiella badensis]|jgi:2-keto-myo-inositol isomerase|uniref:TIM barrel protein n=1 Tax=Rouxiella badensis TaxID=1646377 RepID=UPI00037FF8D4|nr:TIM barrel protein [Rouxiella badensis]QII37970.1 TIM barrel protein [Rouxiella badensis]
MGIDLNRFCVNRKIAPNLTIEQFFQLMARCGLNKVEMRNDMPSGKVTDSLSALQVNALAEKYRQEIVTINAVYPFNQITSTLLEKTEGLLKEARAIGAEALVLCPLNDGNPISLEDTVSAMQTLAPLFEKYGIAGLVEPLGFEMSSLRSAVLTQTLIREAQVPFKIVLDTFHHYLYVEDEVNFETKIDISLIGLVHVSGVEDDRRKALLTDEERLMLSERDLMKNIEQVLRLERLGYQGIYSFEPFSSVLAGWSEADIEREIRQSIALLTP